MTKISKSPDRHTFQKESYIKCQEEKNESVDEEYLKIFDRYIDEHNHKFQDPESRINNMEYDLLTTEWILKKVRGSKTYAQNLYAAICNNEFVKREMWPILRMDPDKDLWSCSWRYAGGIIADMRQEGDYIDWYCSGISDGLGNGDADRIKGHIDEGCITNEIEKDLSQLGWIPVPGGDWEKFN